MEGEGGLCLVVSRVWGVTLMRATEQFAAFGELTDYRDQCAKMCQILLTNATETVARVG